MTKTKADPRDLARSALDDPRPSTKVAEDVGRSPSWVRRVRSGSLFPELERPEPGEEPWTNAPRLSEDDVKAILLDPRTAPTVAADYGVSPGHVRSIWARLVYKDVEVPEEEIPERPVGRPGHKHNRTGQRPRRDS